MKIILALLALTLGGCAIVGEFQTPYGSIATDGKTVRVIARADGFAK